MGTQSGIDRLEITSSFSEFDEAAGLSSQPWDFAKFHGQLYVGTPNGLLFLNSETGKLEVAPGTKNRYVTGLLAHRDRLIVTAGLEGVFEWDGNALRLIVKGSNGNVWLRCSVETER